MSKKKKGAAVAPVAQRSSPRARAVAARAAAAAQAAPVTAVVAAPVASAAQAQAPSEKSVNEAQVQAAFGAHAHHKDSADALSVTTTAASTQSDVAVLIAGVTPSEAASLHSMAQQQDEHQRKLLQLQQQHEQQQQQWTLRQQQTERQDRMQQIQLKLHERIQLRQQSGGGSGSPSPLAAGQALATQQLRQAIIQREEQEMTQSIAEHQMHMYAAMMRDLEMQSGIPLAPLPSPAGFGAELIPAPILPGTTMLDATTAKAYEDFQRARQEQQLRLQQYQQIQHTVNSPSIRTQAAMAASSDGDLVRQQMTAEQERLRLLQLQQQQHQLVAHSRDQLVSSQEQLLIQQHDILRQQQILQGLLQKQQQAAARQAQPHQHQQKMPAAKKTAASGEGVLPPPPAKKRKKAATSPESQMEALVRELIRLSSASNTIEMRTSLDKMTAWVHRSFDVELLKFAQRDFRDVVLAKRPSLVQANQWTSDIQVKCEYIIEKIAQVIMAVSIQRPAEAAAAAAAASSSDQANAIRLAAKEHAYAALKAQLTQQQKGKGSGATAVAKASVQPANSSSSEAKKQPLLVDLSLLNSNQKAPSFATTEHPQNQEAAASSSGAGATGSTAKPASTTAPSAPVASTKQVHAAPLVAPKGASSTPQASAATTAALLSPRLVQQLYEVDLTTRSCTGNDEEDKFYIPVKSIAKVMRRALPDDHASSSQTTAKGGQRVSGSAEMSAVKTEDVSALSSRGAEEETKETSDEEMKIGDEDETKPSSSSSATPVASISLAALAIQKRQEMVERNLQQSGQAPIKMDDDAVAFMQECVTEFILYLTSEAKDQWAIDKKKTNSLLGGHVVQGMDNLGFATYARVLESFNTKIKRVQDAQAQRRVEKKLQDKQLKQAHKLREVAEAKARAAVVAATAAAAAVEAGGSATTTTSVAPEATAAVSSSLHEQALMAREDLSAHQ